ncbi:MAG TPA: FIST N-terminal domain-containing protein [Bryobacteraceae bacterium]|nr:FIST N-terminal domain-containing protein [Bryobacteraceae bacterium]
MTRAAIARTLSKDSRRAGLELSRELHRQLGDRNPHAVMLFASPEYDHRALLEALSEAETGAIVGCSTAGEFLNAEASNTSVVAIGLWSEDMIFSTALARGLSRDREAAAKALAESFIGGKRPEYRFRSALLFTDALAGNTEDLLERLTKHTAGEYQFCGGGAGDDARFSRTWVFRNQEAATDAAAALEILSKKPVGIGVSHGWRPATPPLRVTAAEQNKVISMNAAPAAEVYEEFAAERGERFSRGDPMPVFLHHVIGISTPTGQKLRVPLSVGEDDSITCAAEVPAGTAVHLMSTDVESTASSAAEAIRAARQKLQGERPAVALFFDCAATRLRLGKDFAVELNAVASELGGVPFAGCNTYGQIARAEGQFSGFHNCTAVACLIPV